MQELRVEKLRGLQLQRQQQRMDQEREREELRIRWQEHQQFLVTERARRRTEEVRYVRQTAPSPINTQLRTHAQSNLSVVSCLPLLACHCLPAIACLLLLACHCLPSIACLPLPAITCLPLPARLILLACH